VVKPINVGGENVFPDEVEAVLKYHPDVADAAVVGVDDRQSGQRLVALIQPTDGSVPDLDNLTRFSAARIVGFRMPRAIVVVDTIRRLDSGRPDYEWARSVAIERAAAAVDDDR
jgi:acyl-CoA synthetase (AMP-forming)/AMP-acid ligase II